MTKASRRLVENLEDGGTCIAIQKSPNVPLVSVDDPASNWDEDQTTRVVRLPSSVDASSTLRPKRTATVATATHNLATAIWVSTTNGPRNCTTGRVKQMKTVLRGSGIHAALGGLKPRIIRPRNLRLGLYRGGRRPSGHLLAHLTTGSTDRECPLPTVLANDEIWDLVNYVLYLPYEQISTPERRTAYVGSSSRLELGRFQRLKYKHSTALEWRHRPEYAS